MKLSLGQAAKAARVAKSTISKALKSGDISGNKDEKGWYKIDASELQRWVDSKQLPNGTEVDLETVLKKHKKTPENSPLQGEANSLHQRELEIFKEERERERKQLQERIDQLTSQLDDANSERRDAQTQLTALLTSQVPDREPSEPPKKKGFFARLKG
jgi:ABC-type phosphate transport system auxiliary subunit